MSKSDDRPAFPSAYGSTNGNDGLTMRDWFAGQALASMNWLHSGKSFEIDATVCYDMADAMIKERIARNK